METSSKKQKQLVYIYVYIEIERAISSLKDSDKEYLIFKCGWTRYKAGTRIKQIQTTTGMPESGTVVWDWYDCPLSEKEIHNLFYHLQTYDGAGKECFVYSPECLEIHNAMKELHDNLDNVTGKDAYRRRARMKGPMRKHPVPKDLKMDRRNITARHFLGSYEDLLEKEDIKRKKEIAKAKLYLRLKNL
ncbi:MAG: hypothetical protein ACRCU6_12115 [Fusobacteriaceae bacterium]